MRIDGGRIRGSATATPYERWSEIESFHLGVDRSLEALDAVGGTEDVGAILCTIEKAADLATCGLLTKVHSPGTKRIEIHVCAPTVVGSGASARLEPYAIYELGLCDVISVRTEVSGDGRALERIAVSYGRVSVSHAQFTNGSQIVPGGRNWPECIHDFSSGP